MLCKKDEGKNTDSIYREYHPITPKQVLNVFDPGYLGVERRLFLA